MAIIGALPVTLVNGSIADATQVMADFNYILSQVNANAAPATGGLYLLLTGGTLTGALAIDGTVVGNTRLISGSTSGSIRWQVVLGSNTAEGGSNTGSDFLINRWSDVGTFIDTPLTITRSNALATFGGSVKVANANAIQLDGAAGSQRQISYLTGGVLHWAIACAGAEGGANNGGDYSINGYADSTGGYLNTPLTIKRSTGVCTFSAAIVNGPSDRSLKENIQPLEGSLERVQKLQGVSFNMIDDETKRLQIGLVAQDVAPVVPEIIQDYRMGGPAEKEGESKLALDYPKLTALLIESIKTLTARIEVLEAKLAT